MGKDRRPFAQIDVNWAMNLKWFRVERSLRDSMQTALPTAMHTALLEAMHMHMTSILYCAQNQTNGIFPVSAVKMTGRCTFEEAVTALFDVGLWINLPGGMAEVHDYLEHQPSAEEIKRSSEKARAMADKRWSKNAGSNAHSNARSNAGSNADEMRRDENVDEGTQAPKPRKRGTRIPADFTVTEAMTSWALENAPHVNIQSSTARFVDYWTAASGAKASKLDWVATWRNWIRSDEERAPQNQNHGQTVSDDPYVYLPVIN